MSDEKEQEKPFAEAAYRHIDIEQTDTFSSELTGRHHRNCIKCCGCAVAILSIVATVILVLMFTVFHVKDPVLKMNSLNIRGLNNSKNFGPGLNLTVDVSIKNPNVASFKFVNLTTNLYYNGSIIGETTRPSGQARARSTLQMKVWIEAVVDKVMEILPISLCMRIYGNVKIANGIKKSFVLNMNCTMKLNVSSQGIQDTNCRRVD